MAGVVTPAVSGGASTPEKARTAAGRRSPLIGGGGVGLAQASDAPDPLAGGDPGVGQGWSGRAGNGRR